MTLVLYLFHWFRVRLEGARARPTLSAPGLSLNELELVLRPEFEALRKRQMQFAEDAWRRPGCPPVWRVRDGDLSREEKKHVYWTCSTCRRKRIKSLFGSVSTAGLKVAALMIAINFLATAPLWRRPVPPAPNITLEARAVAAQPAIELPGPKLPDNSRITKTDWQQIDEVIRQLPPEVEFKARLGNSKLAQEFVKRRNDLREFVGPATTEAARLDAIWFAVLRNSGNGGLVQGLVRHEAELKEYLTPTSLVALAEKHARMAQVLSSQSLCARLKQHTEVARRMAHEGSGSAEIHRALEELADQELGARKLAGLREPDRGLGRMAR